MGTRMICDENGWPDAAIRRVRELEDQLRRGREPMRETFKVTADAPQVLIEGDLKPHNDYWRERNKAWPDGPWDDEPLDYVVFESSGLHCELRRNWRGVWCGYVTVPPGSPLCGVTCPDIEHCEVATVFTREAAWELAFDLGHIWHVIPETGRGESALGASYGYMGEARAMVERMAASAVAWMEERGWKNGG